MIFAIVRVAVVLSHSYLPDESWLYLWSSVEQTVCKFELVESHTITLTMSSSLPLLAKAEANNEPLQLAIMIACLASFRVLFTRQETNTRPQAITYPKKQSVASSRRGLLSLYRLRNWRFTRSRLQDETSESYDLSPKSKQQTRHGERPQTSDSRAKTIAEQGIYIMNDFQVDLASITHKDWTEAGAMGGV